MKRCPECRRDYYDDTLLYCLEDGNALLEGPAMSEPPASAGGQFDEPQTAILHSTAAPGESPTRAQIHTTEQTAVLHRGAEAEPRGSLGGLSERHSLSAHRTAKPLIAAVVAVALLVGGFFGYKYLSPTKQIESIAVMPFVNESGNADVEYLSDGMTETLISSLSNCTNPTARVSMRLKTGGPTLRDRIACADACATLLAVNNFTSAISAAEIKRRKITKS